MLDKSFGIRDVLGCDKLEQLYAIKALGAL
jgi:hypothetical protein